MCSALRSQTFLFTLLTIVCWSTVVFAQGKHHPRPHPPAVPYMHVPPLVRLTGALHPPEEKGAPVHTLMVFIQDKEWNFWLAKVDTLSGTNYGWMVLADLFPRELRLSGPEDLLGPLRKSEIVGKPLIVEGRLYRADRKLVVTAVGEPTEPSQ